MEAVGRGRQTEPGAFRAFARFVLCGGGVGLAAGFAVAGLATWVPWALANALVTVVSTLLATELHARFTFGAGGGATLRQHVQSGGSALGAYAVTCLAMLSLPHLVERPGAVLQQVVYLSASALAGVARFGILRLVVFARSRTRAMAPVLLRAASDAASRPTPRRSAARPDRDRGSGQTGPRWCLADHAGPIGKTPPSGRLRRRRSRPPRRCPC